MRTSLIILSILAIGAMPIQGLAAEFNADAMRPIAIQSLESFKELVTDKNYEQMGFKSVEEVSSAKVGDPMQDYMVRLDSLQKYEPGENPVNLLNDTNMVYLPVEVDRKPRSMIIVAKGKESWQPVSFGGSNLMVALSKTRRMVGEKLENERIPMGASNFIVVRIPALRLFLLGHKVDNQLFLTLAHEDPNFNLKPGMTYNAEDVFKQLAPFAKSHDGMPG